VAKSNERVEALTGARALASLYILALHFAAPLFVGAPAWAETLREHGYIATSFFLMLSGFVLIIAYGGKLSDGRLDGRNFFIARLARVYPVYTVGILLLVPFALVHRWGAVTASFGDASLRAKVVTGVAQATMTHVLVPRMATSWNLPAWCVSVELSFWFAFPAVTAWLLLRRTRTLVAVLAGAWGVVLAMSIAYTVIQPDGFRPEVDSYGFWLSLFKFTPYTRWPEFLFGATLGALWLRLPAERRGQRFATLLVAGSSAAIAAILLAGDRIPYTMLHNGTLLPLYGAACWGLMLGRGPLHRVLALRPLTALGDSSYVLYILQVPLIQWMVLVTGNRYNAVGARFTAVALPLTIAASVAIHFFFEVRAQAWLKRKLEAWWPAPRPVTPTVTPPLPAPVHVIEGAG
jgi:peptidoglycan/LPS O-acetylase OafA/YrhL